MSNLFKSIVTVMLSGAITHGALAQEAPGSGKPTTVVMLEAGAFENLSPKDKKVAEFIFDRQIVTAQGKRPLNLDQIALANKRGGWERVYRQMKMHGLTDAKNLRIFVGNSYGSGSLRKRKRQNASSRTTIVTMASGGQIIFDNMRSSGGSSDGSETRLRKAGYTHTFQASNGRIVYRGRLYSSAFMGP